MAARAEDSDAGNAQPHDAQRVISDPDAEEPSGQSGEESPTPPRQGRQAQVEPGAPQARRSRWWRRAHPEEGFVHVDDQSDAELSAATASR